MRSTQVVTFTISSGDSRDARFVPGGSEVYSGALASLLVFNSCENVMAKIMAAMTQMPKMVPKSGSKMISKSHPKSDAKSGQKRVQKMHVFTHHLTMTRCCGSLPH